MQRPKRLQSKPQLRTEMAGVFASLQRVLTLVVPVNNVGLVVTGQPCRTDEGDVATLFAQHCNDYIA